MKPFAFLKKPGFSQRRLFWGVVGIGIVILLIFFGILPLVEAAKKMEGEIAMKRRVIQKYDEFLQNRKSVEEDLQRTQKQYEEIQKTLLPGETPQLGAATLQEIVKKIADKNGIAVRSFRILEPKEATPYRKVSIQIEFNPVNNILSLGQFFYDLEHHEKKLLISEMDLLIFNIRLPNNIQGNLVITGLMKGTKAKEKGKEG
ncbi:MAG TPA: type II secretion system protein GspM [Thermodesulfobacteriota bacterium]|nr:type II secretion system protein GspM [Thermodesulfobacteriota bacterium]